MGGTKKKKVECPVLGREIKTAECGENRGSEYGCPADCPQNPWSPANYGWALELHERYIEKLMTRLHAEQAARYGYPKKPPLDEGSDEFDYLLWFSGQFFRERDAEGCTFKERWEAERHRGLNNDQRLLLEAESGMHPALLEIQQVRDAESVVAVDLLDPGCGSFVVFDRSLAASACRFTTLFTVVYPMPHYIRIHSAAIALPDITGMGMRQVFSEIAGHLGAPVESPALREWLMENLQRVVDSIRATTDALTEAMFRGIDAAYTKTVYELHGKPGKFRKLLGKQEDIMPEDVLAEDAEAGFESEWVCLGGDSPTGQGRLMLGRILLHADGHVQLEASSAKRTQQLKERVEGLFGAMLEFSRECTDDMAAQLADKRALHYDPALVPASLLENPRQIETSTSQIPIEEVATQEELELRFEQEFLKTFLDNGIPLLDGMAPREAAQTPAMRPKLVELMKSHVRSHDENNLRTGRSTDINWLLAELGLDEINFPPPPQREPPEGYDEPAGEDGFLDAPLVLSKEEVEERRLELGKDFEADYLVECFEKGYPSACQRLDEMCEELDLGHHRRKLAELAATVCFLQMKPDPRPLEVFTDELLTEHTQISIDYLEEGDIAGLVESLGQPFIARWMLERLEETLPLGRHHEYFGNCFLYLVSLSEAIHAIVFEIMQLLYEKLERNA